MLLFLIYVEVQNVFDQKVLTNKLAYGVFSSQELWSTLLLDLEITRVRNPQPSSGVKQLIIIGDSVSVSRFLKSFALP